MGTGLSLTQGADQLEIQMAFDPLPHFIHKNYIVVDFSPKHEWQNNHTSGQKHRNIFMTLGEARTLLDMAWRETPVMGDG